MRAPITSVVKHVASSSSACSQYRCRGMRGCGRGIGRMYSMVEDAIGGVGSDMRFSAPRVHRGLSFRCYYESSTWYLYRKNKNRARAGTERNSEAKKRL